jgi:hypothetical protein
MRTLQTAHPERSDCAFDSATESMVIFIAQCPRQRVRVVHLRSEISRTYADERECSETTDKKTEPSGFFENVIVPALHERSA